MRKPVVLVLIGLLVSGVAQAQAYKWVDEDGVVHYSDRPEPGAERVDLPRSQPSRATNARRPQSSATTRVDDGAADEDAPFRYQSLSVSAPAAEETLWNIGGELNVTLALSPPLRPNDQVRLYYDGKPQPIEGTSVRLTEVYRGEHNLQAEVLDAAGALMIRSVPIRFYVQQTSVL